MPLRPVCGEVQLPTDTLADIQKLVEFVVEVAQESPRVYSNPYRRDLEDHFFYLGAIKPDMIVPFREQLCEGAEHIGFNFDTWLYLLRGANDNCAVSIANRIDSALGDELRLFRNELMLAAIATPASLEMLADHARKHDRVRHIQRIGFSVPEEGGATPRFLFDRLAIVPGEVVEDSAWHDVPHPMGLQISECCVVDVESAIQPVWHYLTIGAAQVKELSTDVSRLHLVSPNLLEGWTMHCDVLDDGRYHMEHVETEEAEPSNEDLIGQRYQALLRPFSEDDIYRNHHIYWGDVMGTIGGPPVGIYDNPVCRHCDVQMLFVLDFLNQTRPYGHGPRSLFICEGCRKVACQATNWN